MRDMDRWGVGSYADVDFVFLMGIHDCGGRREWVR